jgi:gamma-glutamylcyclotransferase (GGCT)/AIG2-like uncharacterized protein YtfP
MKRFKRKIGNYFQTRIGAINAVVFLIAVIFFILGDESNWWRNLMVNLSTELFGASLFFFLAQVLFRIDKEVDEREKKVDYLIQKFVDDSRSKVFPTQSESKYNHQFYSYFNEKIEAAKSEIYISGEGFSCKDSLGREIAEQFVKAHRVALKNGVTITRVQTQRNTSDYWNILLKGLLKDYPDNFFMYLYPEKENEDITSLCSIDYSDNKRGVCEFMLSVNQNIGVDHVSLAGLALFVEGDVVLNTDVKNKLVTSIRNNPRVLQVTLNNFDQEMSEMVHYFTYGSNMDISQIKQRCPSAREVGIGKVKGYDIVFNRKGTYREGGVSSIEPRVGTEVFGVVYEISKTDLEELDRIEDPEAYHRRSFQVDVINKEVIECQVYVAIPEKPTEADQDYLNILINAAERAELPIRYIERLKEYRK